MQSNGRIVYGVGCHQTCANCGQVCPTGAIRALPLAEKRVARMGLAVVSERTCLPHAGRDECELCEKECTATGYHAIEFIRMPYLDDNGRPIPDDGGDVMQDGTGKVIVNDGGEVADGSGYRAPRIIADKCVGCGLCQARCYHINVKQKHLLAGSAVVVEAGKGKEDRLLRGSYRALRDKERRARKAGRKVAEGADDFYIP